MKIIVEINEKPREGDMIIFKNGKFCLISRNVLLNELNNINNHLKTHDDELKNIQHELAYNRGEVDR